MITPLRKIKPSVNYNKAGYSKIGSGAINKPTNTHKKQPKSGK